MLSLNVRLVNAGFLCTGIAMLSAAIPVLAGEVKSEILSQGTTSWDGGGFVYPSGTPQLVVQKITVETGGAQYALAEHCHVIPLAAYVLKGGVTVIKPSGERREFTAGDAFIEVVNKWHKGVFREDTQLLVFYAGSDVAPLSFKPETQSPLAKTCE
jgi:quercetin dioxygenase-like cupin family protein